MSLKGQWRVRRSALIANRILAPLCAEDAGHEFHGNQWTKLGDVMKGRELAKKLKSLGFDKYGSDAILKKSGVASSQNAIHSHKDIENVRQNAEAAATGKDPNFETLRRKAMPTTVAADEMMKSGYYGESYGLENVPSRQSVGGVYSQGGYVKAARPSEAFKDAVAKDPVGLKRRGFYMGYDDGGDLMKHVAPIGDVVNWQYPTK